MIADVSNISSVTDIEFTAKEGLQLGSLYKLETGERNAVLLNAGLSIQKTDVVVKNIFPDFDGKKSTLNSTMLSAQISNQFSFLSTEEMGLYAVGGLSARYQLNENDDALSMHEIVLKPWSAYASAGMGIDLKFRAFTISPELRFERSVSNLNQPAFTVPSSSIDWLGANSLLFTVFFS